MSGSPIKWMQGGTKPWSPGWCVVVRPGGEPEIAHIVQDNAGALRIWFTSGSMSFALDEGDAERMSFIARVDPSAIRDTRPFP